MESRNLGCIDSLLIATYGKSTEVCRRRFCICKIATPCKLYYQPSHMHPVTGYSTRLQSRLSHGHAIAYDKTNGLSPSLMCK